MRLAERLTRVATTLLGVILAVTPAALWIAWTASLVIGVMAIALVSAVLLVLLTEPSLQDKAGDDGRVVLPERFIDEVHSLFPLTYHHSSRGPARFRQVMERLSQELLKPR
jgi:hypothetical protein